MECIVPGVAESDKTELLSLSAFLSFLHSSVGKEFACNAEIPYDYTVAARNRFKGLDLTDRVPDEIWVEVRDTVQ